MRYLIGGMSVAYLAVTAWYEPWTLIGTGLALWLGAFLMSSWLAPIVQGAEKLTRTYTFTQDSCRMELQELSKQVLMRRRVGS